jgi:hypothetical protein
LPTQPEKRPGSNRHSVKSTTVAISADVAAPSHPDVISVQEHARHNREPTRDNHDRIFKASPNADHLIHCHISFNGRIDLWYSTPNTRKSQIDASQPANVYLHRQSSLSTIAS